MLRLSKNGIAILKELEDCKLEAYQDSVGVWTIGYGFTKGVKRGDKLTQIECERRLIAELDAYEKAVFTATFGKTTQNEFDALVCLAWNIGISGMQGSTVIRLHLKGDSEAAARAFGLWNKAGNKVVKGLVRRRATEAALYLTPESGSKALAMPQEVDAEKPMTNSTTVIAGGTAALATTTQVLQQVEMVKYSTAALNDWLIPVLAIVALAAIAYIIYERFNARNRGNA